MAQTPQLPPSFIPIEEEKKEPKLPPSFRPVEQLSEEEPKKGDAVPPKNTPPSQPPLPTSFPPLFPRGEDEQPKQIERPGIFSRLGEYWQNATTPLVDIRRQDPRVFQATEAFSAEHPVLGTFLNTPLDMLSGLTTPLDLTTGATNYGARKAATLGFPRAARGLDYLARSTGVLTAGQGAEHLLQAETFPEYAASGLEIAGGIAGARRNLPEDMYGPKAEAPAPIKRFRPTKAVAESYSKFRLGLTKLHLAPLSAFMEPEDATNMVEAINKSTLGNARARESANSGLMSLMNGKKPSYMETRYLAQVFGPEIQKAIDTIPATGVRKVAGNMADTVMESLLFAKTMKTAIDLSAPLRQGLFFASEPEWRNNLGNMLKAWRNKNEFFDNLQLSIMTDPMFKYAKKAGLNLAEITDNLSTNEEAFMSKWASKIPGVPASNRAYVAFLNKLRMDTFNRYMKEYKALGLDPDKDLTLGQNAASFINDATGRSSLNFGKRANFEEITRPLNAVLFSPRFQTSRVKMWNNLFNPYGYVMTDPVLRKAGLKSLLSLGSLWLGTAALAHEAGAQVSMDPTNSDFLKFKSGNFRSSMDAGMQSWAVLGARILRQTATSPTTGKGFELRDAVTNFALNKLSPGASSVIRNYPYAAAALGLAEQSPDTPFDTSKEIVETFAPMVGQDLVDIFNEDPSLLLYALPSGILGASGQVFENRSR